MFWIVFSSLMIFIASILIVKFAVNTSDGIVGLFLFVGFYAAVVLVIWAATYLCFENGYDEYYNLVKEREKICTLDRYVNTIKQAVYRNDYGFGTNFKQSTNLSKYLTKLAEEKAEYNKDLVDAKIRKIVWLYRWFDFGMFIPDKVLKLKLIQ